MKIQKLTFLAAAMAFAAAASANHHGSTAEKIQMLDTDGDGRVSQAEFTAKDGKTAADFARIDTNRDGYVTAAEMDAYKAMEKDRNDDGHKMHDGAHKMHDDAHKMHDAAPAQAMPRGDRPVQNPPTMPPTPPATQP